MRTKELVDLIAELSAHLANYAEKLAPGCGEDAVQTLAVRVLSRATDSDVADGRVYLFSAIRTVAIDLAKGRKETEAVELSGFEAAPETRETSVPAWAVDAIRAGLKAFQPRLRKQTKEMAILHYAGGLPMAEIAEALGVTEEVVKQRMKRFRDRLKREGL